MKTLIAHLTTLIVLLGLFSCESMRLGPNQDSEVSFDMVDAEGNAFFANNLNFKLRQFSSSNPSSSLLAPGIQSPDSSWVIRVVNIDTRMIEELDSLNDLGFNFQFYQKESNDLLVLDPVCSCLNYADELSFQDRFFTNTNDFTDNQRIFISYRKTFSIFNVDPASQSDARFEITILSISPRKMASGYSIKFKLFGFCKPYF